MWAVDTVAVIVLWEWTYPRRFLAPVLGRVREQSGRAVGAFPPRAAGRHAGWLGWAGLGWAGLGWAVERDPPYAVGSGS